MGNKDYRKYVMTFILFVLAQVTFGKTYRVLFFNNPEIKIKGEKVKTGNLFGEGDNIEWVTEKDALRVLENDSKKVVVVTSKLFSREKLSNMADFYSKNYLATREYDSDLTSGNYNCRLLDTLFIERGRVSKGDVSNYMLINKPETGERIPVGRSEDGSMLVITRESLPEDGSGQIIVDIMEKDGEWEYPVYKDFVIEILPLNVLEPIP